MNGFASRHSARAQEPLVSEASSGEHACARCGVSADPEALHRMPRPGSGSALVCGACMEKFMEMLSQELQKVVGKA